MKKKMLTLLMFLIMTFALCSTSFAAEKDVCFVDMQAILTSYPGINDIAKQISDKQAELQKKFNVEIKNLDAQGQVNLQAKYNKELSDFENRKMNPVRKSINNAIHAVMKAKGVDSVVNINAMVAGGQNLTADVVKELKK